MNQTVRTELIVAARYLAATVFVIAWIIHVKTNLQAHEKKADMVSDTREIVYFERTAANSHFQPRLTLDPRQH